MALPSPQRDVEYRKLPLRGLYPDFGPTGGPPSCEFMHLIEKGPQLAVEIDVLSLHAGLTA